MWQVVLRLDRNIQLVLHVLDDADDLPPRRPFQWPIKAHAFAEWILAGPVLARECLIDDDDGSCAGLVLFGERAAAHDRDYHCAEVIRARDAITTVMLLSGRGLRLTFNQIRIRRIRTAERQ